jgi:hypothetical protein
MMKGAAESGNRAGRFLIPTYFIYMRTMPSRTAATVRKAEARDLEVGLICADRDGNRIRVDRIDGSSGELSYHFLNDELRVQEGIQKRSIKEFLAEGWYIATPGKSL